MAQSVRYYRRQKTESPLEIKGAPIARGSVYPSDISNEDLAKILADNPELVNPTMQDLRAANDQIRSSEGVPEVPINPGTPTTKRIRAFTNNPAIAGTEAGPGATWEYAPEDLGPVGGYTKPLITTPNEPVAGPGGEGFITRSGFETPAAINTDVAKSKPPVQQEQRGPMFTNEEREAFRNQIIQNKLSGVDPMQINPSEVLQFAETEIIPKMFERFFQGTILWEDRDKLTPEEQKAWNTAYKELRARIKKDAEEDKKYGEDLLNDFMGRYDMMAKEAQAKQAIKDKEAAAVAKEAKPTKAQEIKYLETEKAILTGEGERNMRRPLDPADLDFLNKNRAILGKKPLVEVKEGKEYKYYEQGKEPKPALYTPEQEQELSQRQDVWKGDDGYYKTRDQYGRVITLLPTSKGK